MSIDTVEKEHGQELPGPRAMGWISTYQALRNPDHPAITMRDRRLTRGELDAAANRLARTFEAHGVREQNIVPVIVTESLGVHVASFALWKLGATPLPLSAKLPIAELLAILQLLNPSLVVGAEPGSLPGFRSLPHDVDIAPTTSDAPLPERIAKHYKAITSGGSTGRPKIIVDSHPSVFDPHEPMAALKMIVDDIILQPAAVYHNSAFAQIHLGLCWGAHVIRMERFDPVEWLRLVELHKVRWAYMVPTMMSRIWKLPAEERNRRDMSSLRVVLHTAAPCPPWLKRAWIEWLGPDRIYEIYSATEATGATFIDGREWLEHPGSVGKPLGEMRILNEQHAPCAPGEVGEIYFRPPNGAGSTYSYIGAESKRVGEWETLGDLGRVDEDGYLYIVDRRTDLIISGGANIYPAEIECALEAHPDIAASAVVARPDADFGSRPHAILEMRNDVSPPCAADLKSFLSERLARYKLPFSYELSSEPLRDAAGKLRRSALRQSLEARLAAGERFSRLNGGDPA
jgi:bile acid-coenzyme A ligase